MDASILVGADRLDNKVHFMAITSDDELHDHVCSWKDEQHLDCEPLRGGLGGQPITEDLSFTFDTGGAALRSITHFTDGGELSFVGAGSRLDAPARAATGSSKPAVATGEQRKLIETFLGKWKWDAQIALPGGNRARAAFDLKCEAAAAGKATLCTLVAGDVVGRPFEATLLLGHDPFDKNVHLMMMSSDDEVWHRTCAWKADTQLACGKMQTGVMGMPATTELTFNVTGQQGSARWLTELRDGKTCLLTAQMSR
jgi:hypothetical protein